MTDWEKELEAADARAKAAALRLSGGYPDEAKYYVSEARAAIAAADAVMFSDESIERAARAIRDANWPDYEDQIHHPIKDYMIDARAAVAALKGDA